MKGFPAILSFASCIISLMVPVGCTSDECLENSSALPQAGFFSSGTDPQSISIKGMTVRALDVPGDSILSDGNSSVSTLYLPFNLEEDQTTYIFSYTAAEDTQPLQDRVTFRYTRQPWFVSSACGAVVNFRIDAIEHTSVMIDSVICPDKIITNADRVNINIYFKTRDDGEI